MLPRHPAPSDPRRARLLLLAALALPFATGCVAPRLVDERCQAPYAGLLARYEASTRTREQVAIGVPGGPQITVALDVVTSARGAGGAVLVLQPGIFADGTTWRFLIGALAEDYDMIAVDPPGTGTSDAPDPRRAGKDAYSPTWLAAHTLGALAAWERRTGAVRDYVFVGHSLGGTVVLRALADPDLGVRHKDLLLRVRGAVLLAPANIAMEHRDPKLLEIALLSDCMAGLGERLGVMQKSVREGVRDNAVRPEQDALRSEALRIEALLGRPATRHAAQAMLQRFQPTLDGFAADLPAAQRLAEQERSIDKPVLLLWGAADKTLPIAEAAVIRERLPREEFFALEQVGHSLHQEGVAQVAERIGSFVRRLAGGNATP